ncbi:RskA family anti-sigma factor, partial [Streptomyces sp. NPDC001478]
MKHHATDTHTLAAAYALGALDDGERRAFDAHLRGCVEGVAAGGRRPVPH